MTDFRKGIITGVFCYLCWGFFPIYWKLLSGVNSFEILAHRVVWSFVFYFLLMVFFFKTHPKQIFKQDSKSWFLSLIAALLLAVNWGLYIYAVNQNHILEGSLAYFINPLLNVLVGVVFFKEEFSMPLKLAVGFAGVGVFWKVLSAPSFPWIALVLAVTFCLYGVVKKNMKVEPRTSSVMEGVSLLLPALALVFMFRSQVSAVEFTNRQWLLLIFSGVVTGIPLFLFSVAAQKIPYSMMGVLQFIAPSLQFLVGYFIYSEPVTISSWMTFALIWIGALFYLYSKFSKLRITTVS